jgi:hypothetical protein
VAFIQPISEDADIGELECFGPVKEFQLLLKFTREPDRFFYSLFFSKIMSFTMGGKARLIYSKNVPLLF